MTRGGPPSSHAGVPRERDGQGRSPTLQLTAQHKVSTPVNLRQGEHVIIAGSVSDEQAKEAFGSWQALRPYLRIVPQPDGLSR